MRILPTTIALFLLTSAMPSQANSPMDSDPGPFEALGKQLSLARGGIPKTALSQTNLSPSPMEQAVFEQVNRYRATQRLAPLVLDPRISQQARLHSQAMASGRVPFSHQGFDQRVEMISRVIPYRGAAENVAYNEGYPNPDQQAVQGWIKSSGHRKNMEGQYDLTGIGIAQNGQGQFYFTQIFIRRR